MNSCGNVSTKISTKVIYLLLWLHYSSLEGKVWRMNFPHHSLFLLICCCLEAVQYTALRDAVHPHVPKRKDTERCCERADWTDFTPELTDPFPVARDQTLQPLYPAWALKPTMPPLRNLKKAKVAQPGKGAAACAIPRNYGRFTPGSRIHRVFRYVHFNTSQAQACVCTVQFALGLYLELRFSYSVSIGNLLFCDPNTVLCCATAHKNLLLQIFFCSPTARRVLPSTS